MSRSARAALCPRRPPEWVLIPLAVLALSLLLSLCPTAQAQYPGGYPGGGYPGGSYDVTYSGGTYTQDSSGPPPDTYTYDDFINYYDATYGGLDHLTFSTSPSGLTQSASVSCDGTLTATLTWNNHGDPTSLPPKSVVVREDCTAWWTGSFNDDGSIGGSCDNPLGGQATGDAASGQNWAHTKYSARADPGASFTVTCAPTANAYGVSGVTSGAYGDCGAGVSYRVTPYPVTLGLSGTTKDGSGGDNILIGQGCTGVLSAGPVQLDNYNWSVPAETFANFEMGTTPGTLFTSGKPYGHMNSVDPPEYQKPNPKWRWKKGASAGQQETVTVTAQASVGGLSIGTVTAEKTVSIFEPTRRFAMSAGDVSTDDDHVYSGFVKGLIAWDGDVVTPPLFGSSASWHFTQLVALQRDAVMLVDHDPMCPYHFDTGGIVLDGDFDYTTGGYGWNDTPEHTISGDYQVNINDSFFLYMMYLPPGDADWVPLHRAEWKWQINMTRSIPGILSGWGYWTPDPPGVCGLVNDEDSSLFPAWYDAYKP